MHHFTGVGQMSISHRHPTSMVLQRVINDGIALFTQPFPNLEGEETSVIQDIERWQKEARGVGGKNNKKNSIHYTFLGVLVAFYVLMRGTRDVSEAGAWKVLVHELTDVQREQLGMTGCLAHTRYPLIERALDDDATKIERELGRIESEKGYARFNKFISDATRGFDPSPYPRISKLRNDLREQIKKDPEHPFRRITPETETLHRERLMDVINKIVAGSVPKDMPVEYSGDIATDETIVITTGKRWGHGSAPEKKHAIDPDTSYWPGKDKKNKNDPEQGFGYGITCVIRMSRPYEKRIPNVVIGLHIGDITGGRTGPFAVALEHAERNCLTKKNRDRYAIGDKAYTKLDDWYPYLIDMEYKINVDYYASWKKDVEIRDATLTGKPAPGPHIISGRIRCPGAAGLHSSAFTNGDQVTPKMSTGEIIKHARRVAILDSYAMPVRNGLKRVKSTTSGRPSKKVNQNAKTGKPDKWSITVHCPAVLGMVNCMNAPRVDGLRHQGVPDIPNPPHPNNVELRPRACMQNTVTYQLDLVDMKRIQAETWGSFHQMDLYETMRSANERVHSQLKDRGGGGITKRDWVEVRGIAKFGLLASIAIAVTNFNLIQSTRTEDGETLYSPREMERRRRARIFEQLKRAKP
jgi:hypothetical protein